MAENARAKTLNLPPAATRGRVSVESALSGRRSIRSFKTGPLSLAEISQILWATQGVTDYRGLRTAPSAGATYPLEVHLVTTYGAAYPAGIYRYSVGTHRLELVVGGDFRKALCEAALGQDAVAKAPAVVAISAFYDRTTRRYGTRGIRYVDMEAGHAVQNLCLQSVALDLGSVVIGAFQDNAVARILRLRSDERPLYLIPVGRPQ
jgi:SagB-type dehydrogenase family enzyme